MAGPGRKRRGGHLHEGGGDGGGKEWVGPTGV